MKTSVAEEQIRIARSGTWQGKGMTRYFERCRAYHEPTGTLMLLSRDEGHHTSGWWKNPEYDRCLHLSLSFRDPTNQQPAPRDKKLTEEWIKLVFGDDRSKLWCEPPYSPEGQAIDVWHYRLFMTPTWKPIIPRGEVYSRELTEAGWKSYSAVRAELDEATEKALERLHG